MQQEADASVSNERKRFEEACSAKEASLKELADKEVEVHAWVKAMRALTEEDGLDSFAELHVGGRAFVTTVASITRFPRSLLASLWQDHRQSRSSAPFRVDGDPTHFQLIVNHLRDPSRLPVEARDSAQVLRWLEREAERYHLDTLLEQCRHAPSVVMEVREFARS
jgi:hypothetical protein